MKYIVLHHSYYGSDYTSSVYMTVPTLKTYYKMSEPEALFIKVFGLFYLVPIDVVKEAYRIQEDLDKLSTVQKSTPHSICLTQGEPISQTLIKKIWLDCNNV